MFSSLYENYIIGETDLMKSMYEFLLMRGSRTWKLDSAAASYWGSCDLIRRGCKRVGVRLEELCLFITFLIFRGFGDLGILMSCLRFAC